MSTFLNQYTFFVPHINSSSIVQKFLQTLLKKGKKKTAQTVLLKTIGLLQKMQPLVPKDEIFEQALKNIQPGFEFKKARVGGMTQFIPGAQKPQKQENLAIRWLLEAARLKHRKTKLLKTKQYGFEYFLAQEVLAAFLNESELKQKKLEIHKLAETNRALAYQRWW